MIHIVSLIHYDDDDYQTFALCTVELWFYQYFSHLIGR